VLCQTECRTLDQLRVDILKLLWLFLNSFRLNGGLKSFLELLSVYKNGTAPEFQMLVLFSDTFSHLVTIMDVTEVYEQEKYFSKHEYAMLDRS
jgi:hypothetical protein